jgi:hypothetical protein
MKDDGVRVHRAKPKDPEQWQIEALGGFSQCADCNEDIKRVPGGHGPTWIHEKTGMVAATGAPRAAKDMPSLERRPEVYDPTSIATQLYIAGNALFGRSWSLTLADDSAPSILVDVADPTGPNGSRSFVVEVREVS